MIHVDIVVTDWARGQQERVGWIVLIPGNGLKKDFFLAGYDHLVPEYIEVDGGKVTQDQPQGFLDALPEFLDGSHVFATPLHDDDSCVFTESNVVEMEEEEYDNAANEAAITNHISAAG